MLKKCLPALLLIAYGLAAAAPSMPVRQMLDGKASHSRKAAPKASASTPTPSSSASAPKASK